jgi:hypothetical protein
MSTNPTTGTPATDASPSDTRATDAPKIETTPPQASTASLRSIEDLIGDAIAQINQSKVIASEFKADLTKLLEDVKARTRRVADVFERVEAVRDEIIEPVMVTIRQAGDASTAAIRQAGDASTAAIRQAGDAIHQVDKNSTIWGRLNLVAGFLGIVVATYFAVRATSPSTPNSGASQVVPPHESSSSPSTDKILDTLRTIHPPRPAPVDGKAFPTVSKVEALIRDNPSVAHDVSQCEGAVTGELRPGADLQARSAATYSLMVCEGFSSHDWKNVSSLAADWGARNPTEAQLKDLSNALYGLAIQAYDVEALLRSGAPGARRDALTRCKKVDAGTANADAPSFLSPVSFQPTDGKEFVGRRVADLEALSDLGDDPHIEIYDHAGGTRAEGLTGRFKDQGLIHTVSKDEKWQSSYQQPEICYKRPLSQRTQRKLKELVDSQQHAMPAALLDPRTYRNPHTHRPDAALDRWLSDAHSNVDLIILLPLR